MKVTVCFGSIRVLVPCGAGDLLVRDLVREATHRYKKATGQGPETWVGVRALRASSGGILDPDDRVCDVADDRETLTAECTSQAPPQRAAQADGASGSSAGTASPDMFRGGGGVGGSMRVPNPDSCVEVGEADLEDGANGLQVRRGSEPTLHQDNIPTQRPLTDQTKRWSAAVVCRDEVRPPPKLPPDPPDRHHNANHFQRQSNRLSMQFSGPGSGNWLDAAERVHTYGTKSLPRDARREPLGEDTAPGGSPGGLQGGLQGGLPGGLQGPRAEDMLRWVSGLSNHTPEVGTHERAISGMEVPVSPSSKPSSGAMQTIPVTLVKGEKGLGFTITTRDNPTGGHCPIYIKNILPKGAAVSDGRLRAGDRLVSVGGAPVAGRTQQQVVALLRNTPTDCSVDIVVERPCTGPNQRIEHQQSPTKYTEKAIGTPNSLSKSVDIPKSTENGRVSSIVNAINSNSVNSSIRGRISKSSSKDDLVNGQSAESALQEALNSSSNSVLGLRNRLILRLDVPVHDSEKAGLGISVKGKVTVGASPQDLGIFIKSVLHGGAASRDGRLHTNDQLLSVNGVSLVGQSNAEAMETLRRALLHSRPNVHGNISLTIARRTDSMDSLARWKDDTPPNGDESNNTNNTNSTNHSDNSQYNTVIYNSDKENRIDYNQDNYKESGHFNKERSFDEIRSSKRHASIVTINNNSWSQTDDNKGYLERDNNNKEPESKRDSFEWSRLDGWNPVIDRLTGLRNESYYMATQVDGPVNGHGPGHGHGPGYRPNHVHMSRSPPAHHNVIIEEDYGTARGSVAAESGSSLEAEAFSRDAVGRRSMSEKRHAALDAKATGTYKKIKQHKQITALQVGPSLGMRKSSSLESLQTAIQETRRMPGEPLYARPHPPLKHWLTDDNHGPEIVRGSPQQSSLSHKKPSIFKSFTTMFRIGKPQKKVDTEIYGRAQPGRSSEKSLSREALERLRIEEREQKSLPPQTQQQHQRASQPARQGSAERRAPHPTAPRGGAQTMDSAWGPAGHYVNYDEIQQNLNVRREKLSEVQIGQMRRQVTAQRAKAEEESRRAVGSGYNSQREARVGGGGAPRPQSNYYEYDTAPPRRPGKLSHYH